MSKKSSVVLICCLLLAFQPAFGAPQATAIGTVNGSGQTRVNGAVIPNGAVLYSGDRIVTSPGGLVFIYLAKGDQLALDGSTAAQVKATEEGFLVLLDQGSVTAISENGAPIVVMALGVRIEPKQSQGSYEVTRNGNKLEVVTRSGVTLVEAANKTVEVREGKLMKATMAGGPIFTGKGNTLLIGIVISAAALGVGLGIALSEQGRTCVSQSGLTCP
jgi:ferric-dicitrate binding protein FerR (iron transport regulator)